MYIKVYIFGMEMSQKNPFLISIVTKNDNFLRKWQKNPTFLVKKNLGQPAKHQKVPKKVKFCHKVTFWHFLDKIFKSKA